MTSESRLPGTTTSPARELVVTRDIDAPRALVFRVWTDPEHLARWWGPRVFTSVVHELNAVPGGAIRLDMVGPDGMSFPMSGVFHEVVEPERLVFSTVNLTGADGAPLFETLDTVTFDEHEGKTQVTVRITVTTSSPESAFAEGGMEQGWNENLERLAEYLGQLSHEEHARG